jgi:hypothetical protein
LALVDVEYTTAYNLSTRQMPKLENPDETRVDGYLRYLIYWMFHILADPLFRES